MTANHNTPWEGMRTDETRGVEDVLRQHFKQVDAYRFNIASIRIRVIDPCFEGMSRDGRDDLFDEQLRKLPEEIQQDIVTMFCFAPSELVMNRKTLREYMHNEEFEDPTPATL